MSYRTQPGTDESLISKWEGYHIPGNVNRHKYLGGHVWKGGVYNTRILDEIAERIKTNQSCVINVTGPPGSGKTYFSIAFAQFFDRRFNILDAPAPEPNRDPSQVAFERAHIAYLIGDESPLRRGQAVVLDESHFGMGSRTFQNTDQVNLVNLIAAVRSKGLMLLIVTLHSNQLDKVPREYVVNYEFTMVDRGKAKVYYRWFPPFATNAFHKGKGTLELPLPETFNPVTGEGCDWADCLRCKHRQAEGIDRCYNVRAVYERRKEEFLNKMSRMVAQPDTEPRLSFNETIEHIAENWEKLYLTNIDTIDHMSLVSILEDVNTPKGQNKRIAYIKELNHRHPEIHEKLLARKYQ
jgi:hypothetical protein